MSKRQWSLALALILINYLIFSQLFSRIMETPPPEAAFTPTPNPTFTATPITPTPTPIPTNTLIPSTPTPTNTSVMNPGPTNTPVPDNPPPADGETDSPPPETDVSEPNVSGQPQVTANNTPVNLRGGPGVNYARVGTLPQGQSLNIVGRNGPATWWVVQTSAGEAWISASVTQASNVALEDIPVISPPPAPVAAAPTNTPVPQAPPPAPEPQQPTTQYSLNNVFGQLNEAITQIRGEIIDASGNPVQGARVRVRSGSFCTVSYPSGAPGGYPGGNYDILLDSWAKPGTWLVAVVDGPADPTDTSCNAGLTALSEEVAVDTQPRESVIYVEWRKNY